MLPPLVDRAIDLAAKLDPNTHKRNGNIRFEMRHSEGYGEKPRVVVLLGRTDNDAINGKDEGSTPEEALQNLIQGLEERIEDRRVKLRDELKKLE